MAKFTKTHFPLTKYAIHSYFFQKLQQLPNFFSFQGFVNPNYHLVNAWANIGQK